jgi:hypothetical protein
MKRRSKSGIAAWNQLAVLTGEMMLASASVIQHRAGRMATATYPLSARDQREFTRMVQEKIEAGQEAAVALALQGCKPDFLKTNASAVRVTSALVKPFHKRAKANARRLKAK